MTILRNNPKAAAAVSITLRFPSIITMMYMCVLNLHNYIQTRNQTFLTESVQNLGQVLGQVLPTKSNHQVASVKFHISYKCYDFDRNIY